MLRSLHLPPGGRLLVPRLDLASQKRRVGSKFFLAPLKRSQKMEAFDEDLETLALPPCREGVVAVVVVAAAVEAREIPVHRAGEIPLRHVQSLVVEVVQDKVDGDAKVGEKIAGWKRKGERGKWGWRQRAGDGKLKSF